MKTQNVIILILVLIIVGGSLYYEGRDETTNTAKELEEATNSVQTNSSTSREAYESTKNQLPHHFAACFATKKLSCTEGECEELEPITFWLLAGTKSNGTISRCDQQGCDTYDTIALQSGIFENVQPKEYGGFLFKRQVLNINGGPANPQSFVDVATTFLTTVTSTGYCIETL